MKKLIWVLLALVLVSSLVLSGCNQEMGTTTSPISPSATTGKTTETPATTKTQSSTTPKSEKYGGTLIMASTLPVRNLGYPGYATSPGDPFYSCPAIESLIDSEYGTYVPRLAKSWDIAEDGKSVTFHLQEGVKFHDGTIMDAEAIKFCFDIARQGERTELRVVNSIDVLGDYTVRFNLDHFDWTFMSTLAICEFARVYSPLAIQTYTPEELATHPVGTGPFKFVDYKRDAYIKYERFDDYWQKDADGNQLPYLDAVEIRMYGEATTGLLAFKAGELHRWDIQVQDIEDIEASGFVVSESIGGQSIIYPDGANPESPFSDVRVRQALAYAIDRVGITEAVGEGYWDPGYQMVGDWSEFGYNPDVKGYPYDPDKARQLLKEAGYANGFKTTIITEMVSDTILAMQENLAAVGIEAKIQEMSQTATVELMWNGWDGLIIGGLGWKGGHADIMSSLVTGYLTPGLRVSMIYPPEVDELVEKIKSEQDLVQRKALMDELEIVFIDKYCVNIPLFETTGFTAMVPYLHGMNIEESFWSSQGKLEKVWLSEK